MKKGIYQKLTLFIISLALFHQVYGDEGMWIPALLKKYNEADMKKMGLKISAEDIYSINHSSLKDAIVLFGRGCTGEIISSEGLLLTNHHCGYGSIQSHSTVEHDYLRDGFWAMSKDEELPNPGLTVKFLIRMEDVTDKILPYLNENMTEQERQQKVEELSKAIIEEATKNTHYEASVKPLYYGNQYFLYVMETFRDVRLVGAPPSSIGKFGGDTDNWMWPRHTGDFSLFRVYTAPDGSPADYSPENIPLKPRKFLKISLKGVKKGDFTMVYGYPFTTQEYLPSFAVEYYQKFEYPVRIDLRTRKLNILDEAMKNDPETKIKYAAKYAGISNGWKKWQGVILGLERSHTLEKKLEFEQYFQQQINANKELSNKYGNILPQLEQLYTEYKPVSLWITWFSETVYSIESFRFSSQFASLLSFDPKTQKDQLKARLEKLSGYAEKHFRDYATHVDREICKAMLSELYKNIEPEHLPPLFKEWMNKFGSVEALTDYLFSNSVFVSRDKTMKLLQSFKAKKLEKDPIYRLYQDFLMFYRNHYYLLDREMEMKLNSLMRKYMAAIMEIQKDKLFYPDANATLRLTYGQVDGYEPADGVYYRYYTTLEGVMEKSTQPYDDYQVPPRLVELYRNKDYGIYGYNGEMPIAFIARNHTSGGNSGSPVLDANGYLVGVNFDRNWEGTMSDFDYNPSMCRNISLDIRYCLFIIDKFAGAGYLIKEMELVR